MQPLTMKTKPLGPRQRLAYIKPKRAELEAAKAKVAAQTAAVEKGQKAIARLTVPALLRKASGTDTSLSSTGELSVYGLKVGTAKERKAAKAALLAGEVKVQAGGGSPGLTNLARRFRVMSPPAIRRLKALDRRIAKAREERAQLIVDAFDSAQLSEPVSPEWLADLIIKRIATRNATPSWVDTYAVNRAESALAEAEKHDGTRTCPCQPCVQARQFAAAAKARAAARAGAAKAEARRLAKLGKVTFTCPDCEHVTEHAQVDYDEHEGEKFVECEACEMGHLLADVTTPSAPGQQELVAFDAGVQAAQAGKGPVAITL